MKTFQEYLNEDSAPATNVTGASVAGRDMAFGAPVYHVPHDSYLKMMQGKERGRKWKEILDDVDLTAELKKRLYSGKPTVLCNSANTTQHIYLKMKDL